MIELACTLFVFYVACRILAAVVYAVLLILESL